MALGCHALQHSASWEAPGRHRATIERGVSQYTVYICVCVCVYVCMCVCEVSLCGSWGSTALRVSILFCRPIRPDITVMVDWA